MAMLLLLSLGFYLFSFIFVEEQFSVSNCGLSGLDEFSWWVVRCRDLLQGSANKRGD